MKIGFLRKLMMQNFLGELKITDINNRIRNWKCLKTFSCKDIYGIEPNEDALKI